MPTVGQVADKISQLRSKLAVAEGLITYLKANYIGVAEAPAEMHFTRADHSQVPGAHVQLAIQDMQEWIETMTAEVEHWENLQIPMKPTAEEPAKKPARGGKKVAKNGSSRQGNDQSEAGGSEPS